MVTAIEQRFGDSFGMAGHRKDELTGLSTVQLAHRWLSTP